MGPRANRIKQIEVVERSSEKAGVGGSIPSLATIFNHLQAHHALELLNLLNNLWLWLVQFICGVPPCAYCSKGRYGLEPGTPRSARF